MDPSRRALLLAPGLWALSAHASAAVPAEVAAALPGRAGRARPACASWACSVYDARLWSGPTSVTEDWAAAPLALEIEYARTLKGGAIAERSLAEMRRQGEIDAATGQRWLATMTQLFPDVRQGDRLTGGEPARRSAQLFANGTLRRECRRRAGVRPALLRHLAGPQTSEPALRSACWGRRDAHREHVAAAPAARWQGWAQGLAYGGLGLPLAFVALPLYVVLPNHYASEFGIPLATLGALLLGARLLDAVADPLHRALGDRWLAHSARARAGGRRAGRLLLAVGFAALFFPPVDRAGGPAGLVRRPAGVDLPQLQRAGVLHQAWGARLGGGEGQRAGIVAWREGLALVGVLVASVLPALAGLSVTSACSR
jgi:hypothetical protein